MKRHGDGGEKGFWVSGYGRRTEKKGEGFGEDEEAGEGEGMFNHWTKRSVARAKGIKAPRVTWPG